MSELLIFIPILIIAFGLGNLLLFYRRKESRGIGFNRIFTIPLGLAILSYTIYIAGSFGMLYKEFIIAVLFLFFILSIFGIVFYSPRRIKHNFFENKANKFVFLTIVLFILITLSGAIAPEIGKDSSCYHLGIPKQFILQHRIGFIPYTMNSLYPLFMEMLYTLGIILKGAILAKLFHWLSGVFLAVVTYFFVREICNQRTAFIASLLLISSPGIFNEMVYAYVDVGLSLYIALSVFCLIMWIHKEEKNLYYLFFSGLFLGFALSIKYIALYMVLPMFCVLTWRLIKKRRELGLVRSMLSFFLPCIAVSFFWYLKSYLVLGNPVFPAFNEFFSTPIKFEVERHLQMGMGKHIFSFLLLPWNLFRYPEVFGGRGSQIGLQYLVLSPFIYFGFHSKKTWFRCLFFIALSYTLIWFLFVQRDRFLYPVLPLFSVIFAYSFYILSVENIRAKKLFLNIFIILILLTTFFNLAVCIYHNRHNYKVALGLESREKYLERWVTNYKMAEFVNKNLDRQAKILLIDDIKIFYFDRWVVRENIFEMWQGYREKYTTVKEMKEFLKSQGFTHIIYKKTGKDPVPAYIQLIINNSIPIYYYGPALDIETKQKEEFFLFKV